MQANVQIASLVVLLKECGPPHLENTIGIAHALRRAVAAKPAKSVELCIVDGVVKRKVQQRVLPGTIRDIVRPMTGRRMTGVNNTGLLQQPVRVSAPGS